MDYLERLKNNIRLKKYRQEIYQYQKDNNIIYILYYYYFYYYSYIFYFKKIDILNLLRLPHAKNEDELKVDFR